MTLLTYASARYSLLMSNKRISTAPVSGGAINGANQFRVLL